MADPLFTVKVGLVGVDIGLLLGIVCLVLSEREESAGTKRRRAVALAFLSLPVTTFLSGVALRILLAGRREAGQVGVDSLRAAFETTRDLATHGYLVGMALVVVTVLAGLFALPDSTAAGRSLTGRSRDLLAHPGALLASLTAAVDIGTAEIVRSTFRGAHSRSFTFESGALSYLSATLLVTSLVAILAGLWCAVRRASGPSESRSGNQAFAK